ncbi:hypothetical protein [Thermococcus peptonophilus]|uniref:hypothetical protein n=1 Tax=Thermococcus peptonophilus TaxID=53952 RepID=UPI000A4F6C01
MIGGLILSHADWRGWIIGLAVALVTFFTFDFAFDSYRAWKMSGIALSLGLNVLAYILPAVYWFGTDVFRPALDNPLITPLTVVIVLFTLHLAFSRAKGWKHPVTYALGNLLPAVPALFAPAVSGGDPSPIRSSSSGWFWHITKLLGPPMSRRGWPSGSSRRSIP